MISKEYSFSFQLGNALRQLLPLFQPSCRCWRIVCMRSFCTLYYIKVAVHLYIKTWDIGGGNIDIGPGRFFLIPFFFSVPIVQHEELLSLRIFRINNNKAQITFSFFLQILTYFHMNYYKYFLSCGDENIDMAFQTRKKTCSWRLIKIALLCSTCELAALVIHKQ